MAQRGIRDMGSETRHVNSDATEAALGVAVDTDSVARLSVRTDGRLSWSSGTAAADTVLSRSAADTLALATGDTLRADVFNASANGSASAVAVAVNDADTGIFLQAANTLGIAAGGLEAVRLASSAASADAAMLLVVNIGGTTSLRQVSVDAVDTAGTGYRALRIPNA